MKVFAEVLKELREESNLSMEALAEKIGVGSSSIWRWENGSSDIKGESLILLSKFFKVTTDYLLGLDT